jgi:hypothetical protein
MEERAAIDLHLPAAESPVRPEEEVVPEDQVFEFGQRPLADHLKIADIILIEAREYHLAVFPAARDQADFAHEFFLHDTLPESRVAGAKNSA